MPWILQDEEPKSDKKETKNNNKIVKKNNDVDSVLC